MPTGIKDTVYRINFVQFSLFCIIRIIVAANATIMEATEMNRKLKADFNLPRIECLKSLN